MDPKLFSRRLTVLAAIFGACLLVFVCVLFNTQITNGESYVQQSVQTITRQETVPASRGIITDRNGKVLVDNKLVYTITFDGSVFDSDEEENAAILRLLALLEEKGVAWTDNLPLAASVAAYTTAETSSTQLKRLTAYLQDRKFSKKNLTADDPTPDLSAAALAAKMREDFGVSPSLSYADARKILSVRYELAVRELVNTTAYLLAEDVDVELISLLNDGRYLGAQVGTAALRQYETESAAHVLGYVSRIYEEDYAALKAQGYKMDDIVGRSGVEQAFESYLRGTDGKRIITTNDEGKITSELYSQDPEPGGTVALTLDIDLQQSVETILSAASDSMKKEDGLSRGAAAAVVQVGSGDVLALASYPSYSLKNFNADYDALLADPLKPLLNRATSGTYPPGSTFKMITAVAALESGVITPSYTVRDLGIYRYYAPTYQPRCWIYSSYGRTHGVVNVTKAITESCNYFFYEVGRLTGIATIDEYARQFGLGSSTGIEIGDSAGTLASPEFAASKGETWSGGQTISAAIGQSYNLVTPLQLANYIATLAGNGAHYATHLLKNVKAYDGSSLIDVYDDGPLNTVAMSESTRTAVLTGMRNLVVSGSVAYSFSRCVVDAAAKTGTAQTGTENNNGVFVCFAPYDDPQIALAIVIEKGGSGSSLASAAVDILNAYFSRSETADPITGENALLS